MMRKKLFRGLGLSPSFCAVRGFASTPRGNSLHFDLQQLCREAKLSPRFKPLAGIHFTSTFEIVGAQGMDKESFKPLAEGWTSQ
jgi:hypothetical protein